MPVRIACPKCHQQYQVADSAIGKPVSCKKCGTQFKAATPAASAAVSSGVEQPAYRQASTAALASFGVDGPLAPPPQIFTDQLPNGMLRNQFEDPGFGEPGSSVAAAEEEVPVGDKAMASIVNNPYAKPRVGKKTVVTQDRGNGRSKKRNRSANGGNEGTSGSAIGLILGGLAALAFAGFLAFRFYLDTQGEIELLRPGRVLGGAIVTAISGFGMIARGAVSLSND